MIPIKTAQQLFIALGVDPQTVFIGHRVGRSRSYTKRGPGRIHQQGRRVTP